LEQRAKVAGKFEQARLAKQAKLELKRKQEVIGGYNGLFK